MACQPIKKMTWKINRDKKIGEVIFVVEGGRNEFSLLREILTRILCYEYIEKKRDAEFYEKKNLHSIQSSRIAVVSARSSNVKSVGDGNFLETILEELAFQYHFDIDNSAIFYIFDRDPQSNKNANLIKKYLTQLKNPYDNDSERGGLFLLSYPALESYIVSSFGDDTYKMEYRLGKEIKNFIGNSGGVFEINKMNTNTILKATTEMQKYFTTYNILFDVYEFADANRQVFEKQEQFYQENNKYQLLSLLSVAFMYLGIIESE